jgi:hypothetical protein
MIKACWKCPSTSQDDWEHIGHHTLCSKQFAQFCKLLFLLCDFIHVSGVGGVPHLDKPYLPGATIYLGGDVGVSITISFLESPFNLIIGDLHYHAVKAELLRFSGEKSHFCNVYGVISHSGRRLDLAPSSSIGTAVPTSAVNGGISLSIGHRQMCDDRFDQCWWDCMK